MQPPAPEDPLPKKKLIEVALPLEAINAQSAREKSIRHGHPSTLHLWWARRPLATARAVLFAQLVDDPSERAEEFREEGLRNGESDITAYVDGRVDAERERLFDLITRMVDWDNLGDEALFDEVRAEILRSTDGNPPAILDPFAGGGTIPLEAQRLGLEAHASDLNPVAVLINKALIEIPRKFAGRTPVFPDAAGQRNSWPKATGLAEDVRRYGSWMRDEAEHRIGSLYPKATLDDGSKATVIAWIWARTVTCPNPACGIEMPLVRSWWLGKKKGKEAYVVPTVVDGRVEFSIGHDPKFAPTKDDDGTMSGRRGGVCVNCGAAAPVDYIKAEGATGRMGAALMATVAEGNRRRVYLAPTEDDRRAADVSRPNDVPNQELGYDPRNIWTPAYGLTTFASLFTNRQLTALTTFSDLVGEARERVLRDALAAGLPEGSRLEQGGTDAAAYADAVATYLGLTVSRLTDYLSSLASWSNHPKNEVIVHVFGRQAIPMVWDFAEANALTQGNGSLAGLNQAVVRAIENLPIGPVSFVKQGDAVTEMSHGILLSTDPPYYDNIGYSDLSDYFYVWLRSSLKPIHPNLFRTMLVPKADELVANPYRHNGSEGARKFFEEGFEQAFGRARDSANGDYPISVYYAFKQSESDASGTASTGWETILGAIVRSGWTVTATWPARSEFSGRMIGNGANALASSIVLALRPRPADAPIMDRMGFLAELRASLPESLQNLQKGNIAPVDMAQAAIGPGMAIFSKYSEVVEPSGEPMSVRDALHAINAILAEVLSQQEGDFDDNTRWCVTWFETHGFASAEYGEAETLASAKNASVAALARSGVLSSGGGRVKLFSPDELPDGYDPRTDDHISLWEVVLHMAKSLGDKGLDCSGGILLGAEERGVDMTAAHELAYLLYSIAEKRGITKAGILFNALGSSWPEVCAAASALEQRRPSSVASTLDFAALED
jgi:putative DNA methylase